MEPDVSFIVVQSIQDYMEAIRRFNPETKGYIWDTENPQIQLGKIGSRGYIEMLTVKGSLEKSGLFFML